MRVDSYGPLYWAHSRCRTERVLWAALWRLTAECHQHSIAVSVDHSLHCLSKQELSGRLDSRTLHPQRTGPFRVIRCLSQSMRNSKNRYFYHILVSPEDAPGAITLNVVWMEREFDAYKLSCWMCPSNYNRFWDRAIYWSKIVIYSYPLHSTPPLGWFSSEHRHPVWYEKLEGCGYQMVKKFRRYLYSFWRNSRTWPTDTGWRQ